MEGSSMSHLYKDVLASILALGIGIITYAKLQGWDWSIVQDWHGAIAFIAILGAGIIALTGAAIERKISNWTIAGSVLVAAALVTAIWGYVADSKTAFYILAANLGLVWILSLVRDWQVTHNHLHRAKPVM